MKYLAGICALFMSCAALAGHHKEGESAVDHTSAAWQIKAYSSAAPDFLGGFCNSHRYRRRNFARGNQWLDLPISKSKTGAQRWVALCPRSHARVPRRRGNEVDDGLHGRKSPGNGARYVHVDVCMATWVKTTLKLGFLTKPMLWRESGIESGPHLMLMPKDPTSLANYPTDFTAGAPYVMFPGTPYAHLMIPVAGIL